MRLIARHQPRASAERRPPLVPGHHFRRRGHRIRRPWPAKSARRIAPSPFSIVRFSTSDLVHAALPKSAIAAGHAHAAPASSRDAALSALDDIITFASSSSASRSSGRFAEERSVHFQSSAGSSRAPLLRRQPVLRLVQRAHRQVDDGLRPGKQAHILPRCRQKKCRGSPQLIRPGKHGRNDVAAVIVGERGRNRGGVRASAAAPARPSAARRGRRAPRRSAAAIDRRSETGR